MLIRWSTLKIITSRYNFEIVAVGFESNSLRDFVVKL